MLDGKNKLQNQAQFFPGDDLSGSPSKVQGKETQQKDGSTLWEIRTQEQPYAFLADNEVKETNRYGQKIDLVELTGLPKERSLFINDNPEVGTNPNRNKQHAFFFTADNCIGCHACEAACSEKNENPAHIAFRSVGYVEGGSYPDYKRMNISMACNHCDNPVCLKGCPTKAYTKHAEYGAVLQDPETCFGCGYCTWVCPYNAPQLDPIKGQVSKCNMCVDRLEVGLKPSCVSACLGNALDFGVVENVPENREQAKTAIPGFPDPGITRPNIRFQQTRTLPDEMSRTDSMPVKYHKQEDGSYSPVIDQKQGKQTFWNLKRLSSRENPLVLFTLSAQAAIGAFVITFLASTLGFSEFTTFSQSSFYVPFGMISFGLIAFALFMSTMHLGKPIRFYRGFNNLRYSPVSREGLGIALFMATLGGHLGFSLPNNDFVAALFLQVTGTSFSHWFDLAMLQQIATVFGALAIPAGLVGLYYMNRCYRIEARPFWNHWQVASSFFGNMLSLGALVAGIIVCTTLAVLGIDLQLPLTLFGAAMFVGLLLEAIGLYFHNKDLLKAEHEGAASHYVQLTTFGKTYHARNCLIALNLVLMMGLLSVDLPLLTSLIAWGIAGLILVTTAIVGRALFYVLVIPTTMPGAFFWKNKGFEEHARDIGLANMPQVGVVQHSH